jgi:hypothetical protein
MEVAVFKLGIFKLFLIVSSLFIIGCPSKNDRDLTIIITGRHQNANEISEGMFISVEKHITDLLTDGGAIAIITSERNPRLVKNDPFPRGGSSDKIRTNNARSLRVPEITDVMRSDHTIATTPENDLLAAINLASQMFPEMKHQVLVEEPNAKIRRKNIIIIDTGLVTTGRLDFAQWGINYIVFDGSNTEIKEQSPLIAQNLSYNNHLPNLKGVNVTFMGLGDVAHPQSPLAPNVIVGLRFLWETIFKEAGVSNISFENIRSSNIPNTVERGFLQPVTPIDFFDDMHGFPIRIHFEFGTDRYADPPEAERVLRAVSNSINKYLQVRPESVYIYLFGCESKNHTGKFDNVLSTRRANRVMRDLERFGVQKGRMNAYGVAVYLPSPPRIEDRPNGVWNAELGALNQIVLVTPSDIPNQSFLSSVKRECYRLIEEQKNKR